MCHPCVHTSYVRGVSACFLDSKHFFSCVKMMCFHCIFGFLLPRGDDVSLVHSSNGFVPPTYVHEEETAFD